MLKNDHRLVISLQHNGEITDFVRRCYLFLLCYLMGGEIIQKGLQTALHSVVTIPYKLDTALIYGIIIAMILVVLRPVSRRFPARELIPFAVLLLSFLISWFVTSEFDDMFRSMLWDFLLGVGGYILFRCVSDWARLLRWFSVMAFMITVAISVRVSLIGGLERYSMYLGYLGLVGVVISMNEVIRRRNILHGVNAVFGFVLLISMGARGPIGVALIFFAVRLALELRRKWYGILMIALVAAAGWWIYLNLDRIIQFLGMLFDQYHLSTRALLKLQATQFLNYSNRSLRLVYAWQLIGEHPFTGVGIGRDRILMSEFYNAMATAIGEYVHNPFFEIWLQFGAFLGSVWIFLFLRIIARALFSKASAEARDIVLIMLAIGFVPLLVSDSYFSRPSFFYSMAVCVACGEGASLSRRIRRGAETDEPGTLEVLNEN